MEHVMTLNPLFKPYKLNDTLTLNNHILMAPLTRCMADNELVPTDAMADYYARRADAGLIISEATIIRSDGQGYPNTPGIFTEAQIAGWKKVTEKVHQANGKMFLQLWHTGRVAHSFFSGKQVVGACSIAAEGSVPRMRDLTYEKPKQLTEQEITKLVEDYAQAAANAIDKAGFDGVEIHGANGYLIDQFLHHDSNRREDLYGGSPENMARFALEIVDAIIARVGADRSGIRLSPGAYFNLAGDKRDRGVFDYLLAELEKRRLAYVHIGIFDDSMTFDYLDGHASDYVRKNYHGTLVGVGSYSAQSAVDAIQSNRFDLIAIGRPFIANPDYVGKIKSGETLKEYDETMLEELI